MTNDTEDLAAMISLALGTELLEKIKTGEAKASDLQVALNFVKHHSIKDLNSGKRVADALAGFDFPFTNDSDQPH